MKINRMSSTASVMLEQATSARSFEVVTRLVSAFRSLTADISSCGLLPVCRQGQVSTGSVLTRDFQRLGRAGGTSGSPWPAEPCRAPQEWC